MIHFLSHMIRVSRLFPVVLSILLLPQAQGAESRPANTIEVTAEARVEVAADLALLDFGVVTQAESAAMAARDNGQRMDAVLKAVRKSAGAAARISAGAYSIRPIYAQMREPGTPRVTGYEVSNVVHLRTTELARIGESIDAAVRAGANQVQRLAFTLADDSAPRRQALRNAVAEARAKADTIAVALDAKAGAVRSVVEQEVGVVRPLARQAMAMQAESGAATPIEPGQVEVRARVVLTAEIVR
jgi:uncharacterized protein YggE